MPINILLPLQVVYITVSDHLKVVMRSIYFQQRVHEILREIEGVRLQQLIFIQLKQSFHIHLLLTLFNNPLHFLFFHQMFLVLPILMHMLQKELLGE